MRALAGLVGVALLGGCSPQFQAAIDAFNGQAVAQLEFDADHALVAEIYGICATPLSTLARNASKHPGLVKGVENICGSEPAVNAGTALEATAKAVGP